MNRQRAIFLELLGEMLMSFVGLILRHIKQAHGLNLYEKSAVKPN